MCVAARLRDEHLVLLEAQLLSAVRDVADVVARLDLADGERALVDDPADEQRLAILALPGRNRVRRHVAPGAGHPGAVEVAEHLVVPDVNNIN